MEAEYMDIDPLRIDSHVYVGQDQLVRTEAATMATGTERASQTTCTCSKQHVILLALFLCLVCTGLSMGVGISLHYKITLIDKRQSALEQRNNSLELGMQAPTSDSEGRSKSRLDYFEKANNHLKNYKVKSEHIESVVLSSGQECWIKCNEIDGCTSASFQTEGSTCELSRVTYINHEVLERARGWEVFTKHTPVVSLQNKSYSLNFSMAKAHCESQGLSIATFSDLQVAYKNGYQACSCGYVDNSIAYIVMQEADRDCLWSVGVIECTWQSTWNVYCKPFKSVIMNESLGKRYAMTLAQARSHCESKGSSLATMEDMIEAYNTGYEACNCGWVDNGYAYIIMQKPTDICMNGIGIIACSWQSTWNAWCKVK